jgi:hypothetical protein
MQKLSLVFIKRDFDYIFNALFAKLAKDTLNNPLIYVHYVSEASKLDNSGKSLTFAAQMATLVSLPFYLQITLERSQLAVGFLMAGWPAGAAVIALIAGRLSDRFSVALLSGLGAGTMALGLLGVVLMPSSTDDWWLFLAMLVSGVGFGFFQTPNNRVLIGSAPRHRAGDAHPGGSRSARRPGTGRHDVASGGAARTELHVELRRCAPAAGVRGPHRARPGRVHLNPGPPEPSPVAPNRAVRP